MSWPVFAGEHGPVFIALLRQRCHEDGLGTDDVTISEQFRLHLHRGIAYLASEGIKNIEDLILKATHDIQTSPHS